MSDAYVRYYDLQTNKYLDHAVAFHHLNRLKSETAHKHQQQLLGAGCSCFVCTGAIKGSDNLFILLSCVYLLFSYLLVPSVYTLALVPSLVLSLLGCTVHVDLSDGMCRLWG